MVTEAPVKVFASSLHARRLFEGQMQFVHTVHVCQAETLSEAYLRAIIAAGNRWPEGEGWGGYDAVTVEVPEVWPEDVEA